MSWAEEVRIETPEQIDFNYEMAGPGSRAAAQLLDWIVKFFWLLLGFLATLLLFAFLGPGSDFSRYLILGIMILLGFIYFVGYDIFYEAFRNGQTPGKKYIGIRVIAEGGGPVDIRAAAVRNFMNIADFLPVGYLIGGVMCLVNSRGQRLGDMAAGTLVVREQEAAKVALLPEQFDLAASSQFLREQLQQLTPQDKHVLESYFQRLDTLDKNAKQRLTEKLYQTFRNKMKLSSDQFIAHNREEMFDFLVSLQQALAVMR